MSYPSASLSLPAIFLSAGLVALPASAQTPAKKVAEATSEIRVDGILDEPAWDDALVIPLVYETRPAENGAAPVETQCLITYSKERLYVAFRALDPEPERIRARLGDRDTVFSDDFVGIAIDTLNDERRAFEFFVNPLGVQMDLFMDDVNGREDSSWDAIWDSAGKIGDEGYIVEIAVPFSSLRFPRTDGPQTWGIDALRFYPRKDRLRLSNNPQDRDISCYLCQLEKIEGFEGVTPGRNLEITPTVTGSRLDEREDLPDSNLEEGSTDTDAGITVKWGMTPNLTLSGTVNPDFSQVEADVARLDVNEQFALFFPERRPFFLEGADIFNSPFNAVFTRNVADPAWGGKLTGKEGKHGLGLFVAQDEITNLLFPGSQGSDSTSLDFETTDGVLRYRRDLGKTSALGVLATSREGSGYSNHVVGADGLIRFTESDSLRFQVLTSETEYPLDVATEFDQPRGSFSDTAYQIRYDHNTRNWSAYARYEDVGKDFRADMGFMPRVDYSFALAGLRRTWWGEGEDWYNRFSLGGDYDITEDQSGQTLEEEAEVFLNLGMARESFLFLGATHKDIFFDGESFDGLSYLNFFYEIRPFANLYVNLDGRIGDAVDFANTQPAEILELEPFVRYDLGDHLRLTLRHDYRELEVAGGTLFEANLSQLRINYQLNLRTRLRAVFQYTDIVRNVELYDNPEDIEPLTERLFTQLLFSYKVNPQTVLFVGYSDSSLGDRSVDLTRENRTFFLKVGYAWVV